MRSTESRPLIGVNFVELYSELLGELKGARRAPRYSNGREGGLKIRTVSVQIRLEAHV